jgi:hypothetical protein
MDKNAMQSVGNQISRTNTKLQAFITANPTELAVKVQEKSWQ